MLKEETSTHQMLLIKWNNGTSGTTSLLCFITGYMFRPIYRSSSGLLTGESVNAMHVGIPTCSQR
jgi:hypothetical protein